MRVKISINQSELQNALSVVLKGVASRSTLPILSGVYFKAYGEKLILQTTDLKLSVQYQVAALIEIEGETVIPVKLLAEIIKSLPDAAVHLETNDDSISLLCEAASFSLKTLQAQDFPAFPEVAIQKQIAIPFPQFSSMVKRVARVVSRDESRMVLTGVLMTNEEGHFKLVATDSYRLAITEADVPEIGADDFEAVISGSFLQDITALPKSEEDVHIGLAENQVMITYQDTIFINRRIEGTYPNYKQLLPDGFVTRVGFDTRQLMNAVKRTSLLSNTTSPIRIDINQASQTAQLSTVTQDVGAAQEILSAEIEGEDVEIAFNFSYVLDGLGVVNTDKVFLETQSSLKPGIFRSDSAENFLYLIMPVRIA